MKFHSKSFTSGRRRKSAVILASAIATLLSGWSVQAATLYWDTNGTFAGSGGATGTWGTSAFWSTGSAGTVATANPTITNADDVIFSAGTNGTTGTVTISSTKAASSITFDDNVTITLSGGTSLTIGGTGAKNGIFVQTGDNAANTISTALILNGANTIQTAGTGVLTISGGVTGTGDLTLQNHSTNAAGITISTGTVNNIGTLTNSGTGAGGVLISSVLGTSVTGVTQNSTASKLTLSGANTYGGTTTVSAGVLNTQNGSALGDTTNGTSVASGAELQMQGNITVGAEALTLIGPGAGAATGALRNLSGTNTYGGLVTFGGATRINSDTGTLTLSNTGTITGATFGLTVGGAGSTTINSIIGTTSGSLAKDGTGTLTLAGANTYTGTTTVSAGVLKIQDGSALGSTTNGTSVSSGAGLHMQGDITVGTEALTLIGTGTGAATGALRNLSGTNLYGGLVTLGGATRINSDAGTLTLSNAGTITGVGLGLTVGGSGDTTINSIIGTGSGGLTKDGTGTLTLNGANTFTGATAVTAGVLNIRHGSALGTGTGGTSVTSGEALQIQGGTGGITVGAEALTMVGTGISNDGALRNISGNNSWAGAITITNTTRINSDSGSLTIDVASGNAITGTNDALQFGGAGDVIINDAIATGSGTLTKDGTGNLVLSGANTYTGATTISEGTVSTASIVVTGGASGLGNAASAVILGSATTTGTLNYTGGAATYTRGFTATAGSGGGVLINGSTGLLAIGTGGIAVGNGATMTFQTLDTGGITANSVISGAGGKVAVNSFGSGMVTFGGANTYTGTTTVTEGVLKAGVASVANVSGAFGLNSAVTLADTAGVSLDITGFNTQIGSLTGGGTSGGSVTLGAAILSVGGDNTSPAPYAGVISGGGALTKIGTGTLTLSGANTYTGTTTISRGTLSTDTIAVSGGASGLGNTASAVVLGTGTSTGTLSYTGAVTASYTRGFTVPVGTGGGGLTNASGSLLTVSSGGIAVGSGATMTFAAGTGGGGITLDSVISGTGGKVAVNSPGSGEVTFNAANTYTGTTTISDGTLSTSSIVVASGTSGLGNAASAVVLGGGTSTGTLSYTGDPATYTRGFNVAAGTGGGALRNTTDNLLTLSTGTIGVGNGASMTFETTGTGGITVNSVISGTGGKVVVNDSNTGAVTFNGANTYTGTTTIAHGTLSTSSIVVATGSSGIGNAASAVILGDATGNTGTLSYTGAAATYTRGFSVTANGGGALVNTTGNLITMSGGDTALGTASTMIFAATGAGGITLDNTSLVTGSGSVVINNSGSGVVTFNGANTYSGATSIMRGTLAISSISGLGTGTAPVHLGDDLDTGTLHYIGTGTASYTRGFNVTADGGGGGALINTTANLLAMSTGGIAVGSAATMTFGATNTGGITLNSTSVISGDGNVTINSGTGTGVVTFAAANTYTGLTSVNAGVLNIQNGAALGATGTGTTVNSGAALQIQGGTAGITVGAEALTLNSLGVGTTGALRNISGNNTFGGLVALGTTTRINSDAGTLTLPNTGTIMGAGFGLTVGGSGGTTINSIIGTTSGALTKDGTGTLTLTGANTFSGLLTVQAGTLSIAMINDASVDGVLGNSASAVVLGGSSTAGTLQYSGGTASSDKTFNVAAGGGGVSVTVAGTTLTLNGEIVGGTLTKTGAGTLTLGGTDDNGGLGVTGSAGPVVLAKTSSGSVHAIGGGGLTVAGATVRLGGTGGDQIYDDSSVTVNSGTFDFNGNSETFGALNGTGGTILNNGGGTSTMTIGFSNATGAYGGVITNGTSGGTMALVKTGTGSQTLSGANTYTGATTIDAGTLALSGGSAIADTGAVTLTGIGANLTLNNNETIGSLTGVVGTTVTLGGNTLTTGDASNTAFSGVISGVGGDLTKQGSGTFTLSGNNTYTGVTAVNAGTLRATTSAMALGTGAATLTMAGGTLEMANDTGLNFARNTTLTANSTIDSDVLTFGGAGVNHTLGTLSIGAQTLTIEAGANVGSGTASVTFGAASIIGGVITTTFSVGSGANLTINGFSNIAGGGNKTIAFTGNGDTTVTGVIVDATLGSTAAVTKSGTGTLTFSNANTYVGTTTVSGGVLLLTNATALPGGIGSAGGVSALTINGGVIGLGTTGNFNRGLGTGVTQVQFTGSGGFAAYNADRIVNLGGAGAAVTWSSGSFVPTGSVLILGASNADKTVTFQNPINFNGAIRTVQVDNGSAAVDAILSGALTGTGTTSGLTKTGAGTLSLTGLNTYTGTTTVSAGTLMLNRGTADNSAIPTDGNLATTSDIIINGGTLEVAASEQIGNTGSINMSSGAFAFSGSGRTETIDKLTVSGGNFTMGTGTGNTLDVLGATVTWSGGTNTITSGNTVKDKHWVITGGTNTVNAGGTLEVKTGGGTAGFFMGGTSSPTITLDSSNSTAGRMLLNQDVTVDSSLTAGSAQILNGGALADSGSIDMQGGTRTFIINNGSDATDMLISAGITNGGLTKAGAGKMVLSGTNDYTGTTTVSAGALQVQGGGLTATGPVQLNGGSLLLGASNVINNSASVTLAGGTLETNGFSEGAATTVGLGALILSANSTIDFGTGTVGTLTFASGTYSAGTLSILNWSGVGETEGTDGVNDRLIFSGNDSARLSFLSAFGQSSISFSGFGSGYSAIQFDTGYFEIVAVPEPATTAAIGSLALCALIGYRERRRGGEVLARLTKRNRAKGRALTNET